MKQYVLDTEELTKYLNSAFCNTVNGLYREKYLTKKQADEIGANYSIIIESNTWLPKVIARWIGLDDDRIVFRLVKAIERSANEKRE